MPNSRSGRGFDRKVHPPFQAIIEKGKQAKAQVEQDQYEARKAKRETEIKNAARVRHAEAEASRRCAEESRLSIDDHKGKLLDEMTKNIKAILEDQYRDEIRAKVYEDEDRIASAYEHDIKDKTKARLVRELESVVKAKLGAEFEPEIKRQLAVELVSVVKVELRAKYETEVKQKLVKDLGPEVETELRTRYETEVKQKLAEQLQWEVKAELRAQYEEEIRSQLMTNPELTIVHQQTSTQTIEVENQPQTEYDILGTLKRESFSAKSNGIDNEEGLYPDLSYHQHPIIPNSDPNGQQETASVMNVGSSDADENPVALLRGTKRSLNGTDDEEENPHGRHTKRSRSEPSNSQEHQLPIGSEEGVSNPYPSELHTQQPYQGVHNNGEDSQGLSQYKEDAGDEVVQDNNGYQMDRGVSGYNSSDEVQGNHENILAPGEDVQGMNGNLSDRGWASYDNVEDVPETNTDLSHGEDIDHDSDEDGQEMIGTFLDHKGADYHSHEETKGTNGNVLGRDGSNYDSAEDVGGSGGYDLAGKATESCSSEEEDEVGEEDDGEDDEEDDEGEYGGFYEEEYESEGEEQYSTSPQAATHSIAGNGVISFSNTQDTAFVLSDSEDEAEDAEEAGDEDKTLVGYDGPKALIDAKHYSMPAEETLFL